MIGIKRIGHATFETPDVERQIDYYTGVVFELHDPAGRADGQLVAGGRYDGLLARLGNVALPAVGFAIWIERLAALGSRA